MRLTSSIWLAGELWVMRSRIVIFGLILIVLGLPTVAALPPCLIQNINYTYPSTPVQRWTADHG